MSFFLVLNMAQALKTMDPTIPIMQLHSVSHEIRPSLPGKLVYKAFFRVADRKRTVSELFYMCCM